ncbi:hypothetical protein HELRODRAFT_170619 [Helobdella robusta]|uniref:CS domain-containing protein n=1 Tax=Helobdella robusta TaxID=6412 RepID=T1F391_HELRO|nr:hypothetical protein HELRODRAFT_170619 [Helobdella robusta]ESO07290.1 hypothetical protein HELRODRAFT_170619 [Helobdella robusta]
MSGDERYDAALIGILQNEGNVVNFLDVFYSFLFRKTDFFRIMLSPTDKYGFQAGVARKLILAGFKKYESMASELNARLKAQYEKSLAEESANMIAENVADEVEVVTSEETTPQQQVNQSENIKELPKIADPQPLGQEQSSSSAMEVSAEKEVLPSNTRDIAEVSSQSIMAVASTVTSTTTAATSQESNHADQVTSGENLASSEMSDTKNNPDNDPELEKLQKIYQANSESYNGAIRENYTWSQSILDLDIRVKVPAHIKKGRDVKVDIGRKHMKVSYVDQQLPKSSQLVALVDGELSWDVHKDEAFWSLVPGEHIHISLEKVRDRWWDSLLTTEPKISVRKIDAQRPITELDDESQAKIEEMMYNERQKQLGLPQSHEKNMHEMLKKAWDVEGSPFRGQPFDLSKVNISQGGSFGTGSM